MAISRRGRPEVMTRCMGCGDVLAVNGEYGEVEVCCGRQRCKKAGTTTPLRPPNWLELPAGVNRDEAGALLLSLASGTTSQVDPLASFVIPMPLIGHCEIEAAFRRDPDPEQPDLDFDPLGLGQNWARKLVPLMTIGTPKGEFKITPDWLREYTKYCQSDAGGNCTPIPTLYLPEIGGQPVTIGQVPCKLDIVVHIIMHGGNYVRTN